MSTVAYNHSHKARPLATRGHVLHDSTMVVHTGPMCLANNDPAANESWSLGDSQGLSITQSLRLSIVHEYFLKQGQRVENENGGFQGRNSLLGAFRRKLRRCFCGYIQDSRMLRNSRFRNFCPLSYAGKLVRDSEVSFTILWTPIFRRVQTTVA
jgi:hypothetical protein